MATFQLLSSLLTINTESVFKFYSIVCHVCWCTNNETADNLLETTKGQHCFRNLFGECLPLAPDLAQAWWLMELPRSKTLSHGVLLLLLVITVYLFHKKGAKIMFTHFYQWRYWLVMSRTHCPVGSWNALPGLVCKRILSKKHCFLRNCK